MLKAYSLLLEPIWKKGVAHEFVFISVAYGPSFIDPTRAPSSRKVPFDPYVGF
jgi:hypothetical protein